MNGKITIFAIIMLVAILAAFTYRTNPQMQKLVAMYTEEDFSEQNIYSDLESLAERLEEEILRGSDSFTVYLENMETEEIYQINEWMDGIYGSGESYQQLGVIGDRYKKVVIMIGRTPNYYAMRAYMEQEPIPDKEPKAQQLYEAIQRIMADNIADTMNDFEKELALHDYLVKNCEYSQNTSQPAGSDIYRAYGALVNQEAVCNGYAEALQLLLRCAGIESEFVVGTANGIDHAWNLVQLDGQWYHLDATWNDPLPDRGDEVIHPYFNVSDEIIALKHSWNREQYPRAVRMDYNYYVYHNRYYDNFELYREQAYEILVNEQKPYFEAAIEGYVEKESDMQFVFENSTLYSSVNWQTFWNDDASVLVMKAE